jgi:exosortase family protein XrtF
VEKNFTIQGSNSLLVNRLFSNPLYSFTGKAFGLYFFWYLLYEMWLHPKGDIDKAVISNLVYLGGALLKLFGFDLIPEGDDKSIRVLGIDGTHGLWVGDPCNGLTLFALFMGFIIAFPGPVKHKLWYIPAGLIAIHIINVFRIIALTIIVKVAPEYLDFNHTYTFTFLVYSFVFLLWMIWVNKFSGISFGKPNNSG